MVSMRTLFLLYKAHLRARPLRELLALLGIAAGVALLFAVQVANKSVTGSFEQLTRGVAGRASLEVAARSPQGFSQGLFRRVRRQPGVEAAAPVLARRIAVRGPKGRRPLTLVGFDSRLARLGGSLVRRFAGRLDAQQLGLYLTASMADAIGATQGEMVTVEIGERSERTPLAGVLAANKIGSLSASPLAVAHLGLVQELVGMPGRITSIPVVPLTGRKGEARAALERAAGGSLNVRASDKEAKLLQQAATPDRQSSALFSITSLVVGILLAYNAMLLTVLGRRRVIASMDMLGASDKTIVASLVFDALVLGLVGSLLGLLLGDQLSRYVLHQVPSHLTAAFPIGGQRIVTPGTIVLSVLGGTLAALAAAAGPAVELLRLGPLEAFSERGPSAVEMRASGSQRKFLWGGIALTALAIATPVFLPETTLFAAVAIVLAMLMILPSLVTYLLSAGLRLVRQTRSATLRVAVGELAAAPIRATALAAVGALAVFSILAIIGPTRDIQRGMQQLTANFFGNADLWVTVGRKENATGTLPFDQRRLAPKIKQLPEIKSVRTYRGSFLDVGDRRLWVIAESPAARLPVAPSQIIRGDADLAASRLRRGGWAALTEPIAQERKLVLGEGFSLPTPSGNTRFKLAATVTNYGWPPGVAAINSSDYARIWHTRQASALEVDLVDGTVLGAGKRAVQRVLASAPSLQVRTAGEQRAQIAATTRDGLARLNQIADMVVIAAILAVAAAMLGSIWLRRQRLWGLVSLGAGSGQLYRTILFETGAILLIGCVIGAVFGSIGQAVGGRWMQLTAGYPVPYLPAWGLALKTLALITVLAALAAALPMRMVFSARRVPALSSE